MTQFSFPFFFFKYDIGCVKSERMGGERKEAESKRGGDSFISTYVNQPDRSAKVELRFIYSV